MKKLSLVLVTLLLVGAAGVTPVQAGTGVAAAKNPCAKQKTAVKKARTRKAKARAKRRLTKCKKRAKRKAEALLPVVSVSPLNPIVDDSVTVTIRPKTPLGTGHVYRVLVNAFGGRILDGHSHLASKDSTSKTVIVGPYDDPLGGSEWGQGKGAVFVSEVPSGSPPETAGTDIGISPEFRFVAKP